MIRDFAQNIVLTSQNNTAFVNFRYEYGDNWEIKPRKITSIAENILYVNGIDIASTDASIYAPVEKYMVKLNDVNRVASFFISSNTNNNFNYNLTFDIYTPGSYTSHVNSFVVSIKNRQNITNISTYNLSNVLVDSESSFMVIRTNPKLTGNIKLIADSSNRLYLDTFKISDELNNKKYRHQIVSSKSNISGDIKRVFGAMPESHLYKLDESDSLNISIPKTDINYQFNTTYSYGARLFKDDLYPEKFSLLAPLWVNNKLPDYFCIFKIPGSYNTGTYKTDYDLNEMPYDYIKNGNLFKTWSIKETTPIGDYMRNHLVELNTQNVRAPLFLPLSDVNQQSQDYNTWNGIAWKSGITTGLSEHPYSFNKLNNYTEINSFLTLGFERLNLISPNLFNLEYAFNDEDASMYTMSKYFGLYLTDNPLYKISYYATDPCALVQILPLDGKNPQQFLTSNVIFDFSTGKIKSAYENRIFSLNDINSVNRFYSRKEVNGSDRNIISKWLNKPGNSLFSIPVKETSIGSFMTFKINNLLQQGEHFRVMDSDSSTYADVWEVYGTNSDIYEAGECGEYCEIFDPSTQLPTDNGYPASRYIPIVRRTCFSTKGTISDQITAIKKAFDKFSDYEGTPFRTLICNQEKGQLSLEILPEYDSSTYSYLDENTHNWQFYRLSSNIRNDINDPSSAFSTAAKPNDVTYFDMYTPTTMNIVDGNDVEHHSGNTYYRWAGPYNFELYGDRQYTVVPFIKTHNSYIYSFSDKVKNLFKPYTMYLGQDNWYRLVKTLNINSPVSNGVINHVADPTELNDNHIILTTNKLYTVNGMWNAYDTYELSISLMGINNVKDMDFTVYDSSLGYESVNRYDRFDDASSYIKVIPQGTQYFIPSSNKNSYTIIKGQCNIFYTTQTETKAGYANIVSEPYYFNNFEWDVAIEAKTDTYLTYDLLDGVKTYTSYDASISEENLNDYYTNSTKSNLKYGLTIPYVVKWVGLGDDCRNNEYSLMLNASLLKDSSSNFIPYENNFNQELSYPSFKYLSSGTRAWENYVYNDINDTIKDPSNNYYTFKDLMFKYPYLDVFSKLIYSNSPDTVKIKDRSTLAYYNTYKQSIDMLVNGLNLSFSIDAIAKNLLNAKNWDKYRVSFISSASYNRTNNNPIELIINENTKTILIIWYQGADNLNYNKRFSSKFNGKNVLHNFHGDSYQFHEAFKYDDKYWSYNKCPFVVKLSYPSTPIKNIYDSSNEYPETSISPYNQFNTNVDKSYDNIFNSFGYDNSIHSLSFNFSENTQYNTLTSEVSYGFTANSNGYGEQNGTVSFGFNYMNNENLYTNSTCSLQLFEYLINHSYISCNIIRDNLILTNRNFTYIPIHININNPRQYKNIFVHNGWFKPKFNKLFNFSYNEDVSLGNIVKLDFTLSNTNLTSSNKINQYWYNKVVSNVTDVDVSTKNAINYIKDYNLFLSQWDKNYYIKDDINIDGWKASRELPSFFGSKLPNLPSELILTNWNINNIVEETTDKFHRFKFNLSRQIIDLFVNNTIFVDNWANLGIDSNTIKDYISDTIISYYKIDVNKIETSIYTKLYDGTRLYYNLDGSFSLNKAANFNGNVVVQNNEYIYQFETVKLPDLSFYIEFKIFEK